ncbi:hypothetical protein ACWELO_04830 [Streptomyces sp. NPDC004596]
MIAAVVGAGDVARGTGTRAVAGGHSVRLHERTRAEADEPAAALGRAAPGADVTTADADATTDAGIAILL